ncbi:serine/threonine protein kinase [Pedobacter antarcticus]|uniref:serine/threonine protein kinase n=1 Tax=Pedobacter antarcticus TaxID=34086 RepID=UPI00088D63E9|nr:serine/threonine-protein kinase [Pedobacter antarcticus]SDL77266.1 serine/threonine protein kinase [Pedobacter antarcticus]
MSKVFTIAEGLENMGALRTGGQGSVYKGRRYGPIITAVKILPTPVHAEGPEDKNFSSFQNEVEKLKKVNEQPNPNIVKILNSGITESGSFPFIEMEFIAGPDLEELLGAPHDPVFTIKEVIKVADHLANALAHCHGFMVRHGDIKSNNIKFNVHTGNYVLLDFGLSVMSDEQRRTSIRHAGAIEFMAPEQSEGQMLAETDIYSYGIILYELLAGQVPFPLKDQGQKSRNEVLVGHLELVVPDLLELRAKNIPANWSEEKKQQEMQVPAWLMAIISRCLEKKPSDRYADGLALQEALIRDSVNAPADIVADQHAIQLLEQENARLQTQLRNMQNAQQERRAEEGVVVLSKAVFFVLILAGACMFALLCYFLLTGPAKSTKPVKVPVETRKESPVQEEEQKDHGYSWDKDTVEDIKPKDTLPVQLKPVPLPQTDTTLLNLDTTIHF